MVDRKEDRPLAVVTSVSSDERWANAGRAVEKREVDDDMTDMPTDNKVQLGCGTLIIIAIIVMLFSGGNDSRKLSRQLDDVNRKLDRLEKKVDELSVKLGQPGAGTPR